MKSDKKARSVKLLTVYDARRLLAQTINQHRLGKLTDNQARCQGYLLERLVKIIAETENENRLAEIEKQLAALVEIRTSRVS